MKKYWLYMQNLTNIYLRNYNLNYVTKQQINATDKTLTKWHDPCKIPIQKEGKQYERNKNIK